MATESIVCPDCGATIDSMEHLETQEVQEISERPRGGIGYGSATENLYLCKKCRKPLGIGKRGSE